MGLSNFTTQNDDDDTSGPGGPSGPPPPAMGGITGSPGNDDVEEMLIDYNERFKTADPAQFRDQLIAQTISVLISKDKPNPLIVGPAGVGKTRIVEDIARRIAIQDASIPAQIKNHTVYELPLSNLVAGAGMVGALEARLAMLVDFASEPKNKAILFIDEIHLLQDSKDPVYSKVAQILKPALARGDMRLIGATTANEAKSFDTDPAFSRRFSRLIVDELTREQTYEVLKGARASMLAHYRNKVTISDDDLHKAVVIADENSKATQHRPDNALTLVDRTMAETIVTHMNQIAEAQAAGDQATVNALQSVGALHVREAKLQTTAKKLLTGIAAKKSFDAQAVVDGLQRIKGQDEITGEIVDMLARDSLSVFPRTKPVSWMFAGPSGVGKTEVSRIIAEELTGQEPIILNMAEYSETHSKASIIGSPPGYVGSTSSGDAGEKPFDTLESNPYRVVVLDEMEKAHQSVQSLMLSALDDGWLRMADGSIIDFSKSVIVATTNAARDATSKPRTGFQSAALPARLTQAELVKKLQDFFTPEFLGRFTKIVAFNKLDLKIYAEILEACYERERLRIMAESPRQGSKIPVLDDDTLQQAAAESYLPDQGARPAEQTARTLIEDALIATQQPLAPAAATMLDEPPAIDHSS